MSAHVNKSWEVRVLPWARWVHPGDGVGWGAGAGVREARAGGSRVSRGRSQVDLAGWQATQWFKLGNNNIDLTELS